MSKKISRFFGGLIFTLLMLCMLAGTVLAAEDVLYINGVKYTSNVGYKKLTKGGFSWIIGSSETTLTLNNATITETIACACGHNSAIHYEGTKQLRINLQGTNTIDLTASASGTQKKSGIVASDSAGKAGATVTIAGEDAAEDGKNPSLTLKGISGEGIFCGYAIVSGADLRVTSDSYGIHCPKENGCLGTMENPTKKFTCSVEIHTTGDAEAVNIEGALLLLCGGAEFYSEKKAAVKANTSAFKSGMLASSSLIVAEGPDNVISHLQNFCISDKLPDGYFGKDLKSHYVWIYDRGGNIADASEKGFSITLSEESYRYDGKAKTPSVTVKDRYGAKLIQDEDYTVVYDKNVEAGNATVTIEGLKKDTSDTKHYYQGKVTKNFRISDPIGSVVTCDKASYKILSDTEVQFVSSEEKQNVTIPETVKIENDTYKVTSIAAKAFFKNTQLRTVRIGKNIKSIGNKAFSGCSKLTSVLGGNNVEKIGARAFYGCASLRGITLNKKVTTVGAYAFKGCKNLGYIKIKSKKMSASTVNKNAFKGLGQFTIITVPSSVRKIYYAFLPKQK